MEWLQDAKLVFKKFLTIHSEHQNWRHKIENNGNWDCINQRFTSCKIVKGIEI
jgi:glutaredoxin-related protein